MSSTATRTHQPRSRKSLPTASISTSAQLNIDVVKHETAEASNSTPGPSTISRAVTIVQLPSYFAVRRGSARLPRRKWRSVRRPSPSPRHRAGLRHHLRHRPTVPDDVAGLPLPGSAGSPITAAAGVLLTRSAHQQIGKSNAHLAHHRMLHRTRSRPGRGRHCRSSQRNRYRPRRRKAHRPPGVDNTDRVLALFLDVTDTAQITNAVSQPRRTSAASTFLSTTPAMATARPSRRVTTQISAPVRDAVLRCGRDDQGGAPRDACPPLRCDRQYFHHRCPDHARWLRLLRCVEGRA